MKVGVSPISLASFTPTPNNIPNFPNPSTIIRRRRLVASSSIRLCGGGGNSTATAIATNSNRMRIQHHPIPLSFTFGISNKKMEEGRKSPFCCCRAPHSPHSHRTSSAEAAEAEANAKSEAAAHSLVDHGQRIEEAEKGDFIIIGDEDPKQHHHRRHRDHQPVELLPSGLRTELLPKHVAIIMDGNSRWAASRGLPTSAGHTAGYMSLKQIITLSCKWGIGALTVFAFSDDNWRRPTTEVDFLMMMFQSVLKDNLTDMLREGIRVCIIGDLSKLPKSLRKLAKEVEESTRNNSRLDLVVAISYSGRSDIVQACQRIALKVKHGLLEPAEVNESLIAQELETNCVTRSNYPDLLIRTSGELRLSNFLLWQSAYTELYFAKVHWPDFGEADYIEALSSFQRRQRRFGQRTV